MALAHLGGPPLDGHANLDLGIVGNCQYNALVDRTGNVAWLCWPRFDSSFVCGSLLDQERGGRFRIGASDGRLGRQSYVENTNILVTRVDTDDGAFEVTDFAPRFWQFERSFKPMMLVRIVRPVSGHPFVKVRCEPRYDYGLRELTGQVRSNHLLFEGAPQPIRLHTDASLYMILEGRPFALTRPAYFVLTWGQTLEHGLPDLCESYLERTKAYWQRWVKHCHLPRSYQRQVIRSALVLKLHQFEDTGAIIAAATTSIPEADRSSRNWDYRYCWLRDTQFALEALRLLGHFEEMEVFVSYLRNIVEQSSGPLQPVYGVTGEALLTEVELPHLAGYRGNQPVRVGNQAYSHIQNDIYGEMIIAISPLFVDARFALDASEKPKSLLVRLLRAIEHYLEKEDAGLWEFRSIARIHTFSVLMHWAGAKRALEIAEQCAYDDVRELAERLVSGAERLLNERCFLPEIGAFGQAAGSSELDAALLQMVNLRFLSKDDPRALSHVSATAERLNLSGQLLRRYKNPDDFGQTENAFVICSFWLAEAWARIGQPAKARAIFEALSGAANSLGLYSEDVAPQTFEQWGNFPQVYSHVGLINAAFALSEP